MNEQKPNFDITICFQQSERLKTVVVDTRPAFTGYFRPLKKNSTCLTLEKKT